MMSQKKPNNITLQFSNQEAAAIGDVLDLLFQGYTINKVTQIDNYGLILDFGKNEKAMEV